MNNSYLVNTGKCLGYCSVLPPIGEGHMFGDTEVKFAYNVGDILFFESHVNDGELREKIESQKKEIENLQKPALSLAYRVLKQKYEEDAESYIEHIFKIESEIESQKEEIEKLKSWVTKLQDAHQIEEFNLYAEIKRLKSAISMISMYNGAIDSFEEIETIINSLKEE